MAESNGSEPGNTLEMTGIVCVGGEACGAEKKGADNGDEDQHRRGRTRPIVHAHARLETLYM
jgi:hypothetical protein